MCTSATWTFARLGAADVDAVARLHLTAFPGFFLSSLGPRFLTEFYRSFVTDRDGISVVARAGDGRLLGVAVGTTTPAGFFRRLLIRRGPWFAAAALRSALSEPSCIARLLRAVRYRGGVPTPVSGALLNSICVDPDERRLGVGAALLTAWSERARDMGAHSAFLTTDAAGNDAVNAFYRRARWSMAGSYPTPEGRQMNCYTIELAGERC